MKCFGCADLYGAGSNNFTLEIIAIEETVMNFVFY